MYIETSSPRVQNDNAKLSFTSAGSGSFCMTFYYHMNGGAIGALKVYSGGQIKFSKSGSQGTDWQKAEVDITASGSAVSMTYFRDSF